MKILCICPIGIGNYLLFYPACVRVKEAYPTCELHLLALRKSIADLAETDPLWSTIHQFDPTKKNSVAATIQFFQRLRAEQLTTSLSFFPSNTWQYNLLPVLAGIKNRIAFGYARKKFSSLSFLNTRKIPVDPALHDVKQNIRLSATCSDTQLSEKAVQFPKLISPTDREAAQTILKEHHLLKIAIHPGSSAEHGMDAKRWPPERFGQFADKLCAVLHAEVLIFGGPDERDLKTTVAQNMHAPCRIIEPCNLKLTAALLRACTLCCCNDSGIMHIAACSGVPVIALFGPTDEQRNGPYTEKKIILRKPMAGFPLWTAANVGDRSLPSGIDPRESLLQLSVDDAWEMTRPSLAALLPFIV